MSLLLFRCDRMDLEQERIKVNLCLFTENVRNTFMYSLSV
jgi:hypothetical protein